MQRLTITGAINGVNDTFTLNVIPSFLKIYRNGVLQKPAVDFVLTGNSVVFQAGAIPLTGDLLFAIDEAGAIYLVITGAVDGVNDTFTLNAVPLVLELTRNGLLQTTGLDYTLSMSTVVFAAGAIPQAGDLLLAITDAATLLPASSQTVAVQEIYAQVCFVLCEDGGLVLGLFTPTQFLNSLAVALLDFCQRTALDKTIFTAQINISQSQYTVPEDLMKPELCFVSGRLIEKVTEADLTQGHFQWKGKIDKPRQWHEDNLPVKKVELFPKPDYNGTAIGGPLFGHYGDFFPTEHNLTIVGPAAPSKNVWALIDTLDGIPASFSQYLVYGILEQAFSQEGETRDVQRAAYCHARWEEGLALAQTICVEELLDEEKEYG